MPFPVRYRVQAVDKYDDASVLSDFANSEAWKSTSGGPVEEDNRSLPESSNIPKEFALNQNYPNPFNPSTNIQYDIPFESLV